MNVIVVEGVVASFRALGFSIKEAQNAAKLKSGDTGRIRNLVRWWNSQHVARQKESIDENQVRGILSRADKQEKKMSRKKAHHRDRDGYMKIRPGVFSRN